MKKLHLILLTGIFFYYFVIFFASGHRINPSDKEQLKFLFEITLYLVATVLVFMYRRKITEDFNVTVVILLVLIQGLLIYSIFNLSKIEYVPILLYLVFIVCAFVNFILLIIHLVNGAKSN